MTPTDSTARFDSTGAYYAEYRPGYGDRAMQYLVDRFGLDDSSRVLDLGCGAGQIAVPLSAHVGRVMGVDPNETMLEYAHERAADEERENVEWVVVSGHQVILRSSENHHLSHGPHERSRGDGARVRHPIR